MRRPPDEVGNSATGQQLGESQKGLACPKAGPNRRRHRSAAPPRAEGHCTGARQSAFSLPPGAAHSLFGATKKRMGGAPLWEQPPAGAGSPVAAGQRPIPAPPREAMI